MTAIKNTKMSYVETESCKTYDVFALSSEVFNLCFDPFYSHKIPVKCCTQEKFVAEYDASFHLSYSKLTK